VLVRSRNRRNERVFPGRSLGQYSPVSRLHTLITWPRQMATRSNRFFQLCAAAPRPPLVPLHLLPRSPILRDIADPSPRTFAPVRALLLTDLIRGHWQGLRASSPAGIDLHPTRPPLPVALRQLASRNSATPAAPSVRFPYQGFCTLRFGFRYLFMLQTHASQPTA